MPGECLFNEAVEGYRLRSFPTVTQYMVVPVGATMYCVLSFYQSERLQKLPLSEHYPYQLGPFLFDIRIYVLCGFKNEVQNFPAPPRGRAASPLGCELYFYGYTKKIKKGDRCLPEIIGDNISNVTNIKFRVETCGVGGL